MPGPVTLKIFQVGQLYRAKKSFMTGPSVFVADEVLRFEMDGFSHYDDCDVYQFHSQTDGQKKTWWRYCGDPRLPLRPEDEWQNYFEPLERL